MFKLKKTIEALNGVFAQGLVCFKEESCVFSW